MAIYSTTYKDRPAVSVESGTLTALFLPLDGGKMASLKTVSGYELLAQAPGREYRVLKPDGSYTESECSGFDDMFPTIDPYMPTEGEYSGITYPDHGEVCRMPAEIEINGKSVSFRSESGLFPVIFEKIITTEADGSISISYNIHNNGREPFPYIWAAHCMLAGENDAQIILPFDDETPIRMMFGPADVEKLNRTQLSGFTHNGATYKYYFLRTVPKGYCGYRYTKRKEELLLLFDEKKIRCLGVWLNNGGFKDMYNIALEPCTAPFDRPDTAESAGCESIIPGEDSVSFKLRIYWHKL